MGICVTIQVSYENTAPDVASAPDFSAPGGPSQAAVTNPDVWSDDEDEDNDRLHFACHPLVLPLSIFFHPFYGFDDPTNGAFPPPVLYLACPHVNSLPIDQAGANLKTWHPPGFHRIIPAADSTHISPTAHVCFSGVAFDNESVVCFICHEGTPDSLEVRSSSQRLLQELMRDVYFWLLAA